ncbi:SAM-dependent methyltransferase [Natranaerobius thermophilus]|uniref:Methyltransferase type 11 n=1 Tax=Natranaerobius thermophilus (strain ATCC BAA-1301 / DSM 18059 / JW/NM-WN-LF) TaxID=457570 RepID=B2A775_NATTJ|nr:class I SAM-dependent methyltransferase [Natranaerobius thermophilus]ACB84269.1 Methyltransferase type 11 [Natranaerobius thermophilus JW/NM-WN-LF]
MTTNEYAQIAKDYYNSTAHEIYKECWGGENHHLGIFDNTDDFYQAAQKANENLVTKLQVKEGDHVLDIGSGFCGLPRYIVKNTNCEKVTALNISEKENEYARQKNKQENLHHKIDVVDGDFNNMPFPDKNFDILVSQDSMLHSPNKKELLEECFRVIKPGGMFVFSDILKLPELTEDEAKIVYNRINVPHLATFDFYEKALIDANFNVIDIQDLGNMNLAKSYQSVYDNLNDKKNFLMKDKNIPQDRIDMTLKGLKYWVEKASDNKLGWGLFVSQRPNNR